MNVLPQSLKLTFKPVITGKYLNDLACCCGKSRSSVISRQLHDINVVPAASSLSSLLFVSKKLENPESITINGLGVISVRYRKTRWVPRRAPSKIYYVRQPTPVVPEEKEYLSTELKIYNTKIKSIYAYLKSQKTPISSMVKERAATKVDEEEHLAEALALNTSWNEKVAEERMLRQLEEDAVIEKSKQKQLESYMKVLNAKQSESLDTINKTRERRKAALDMDKLDEELDAFLEQEPVDHNFAITPYGERVKY